MLQTMTTQAVPPAGRLRYWNEAIGAIFPGMVIDASLDLDARWRSCRMGDVVVATARSQRATIRRWHGAAPDSEAARGLIHLQHSGFSATNQHGRNASLFAGDLTFCLPDARYRIDLSERNDCIVIDFPLRMLCGAAVTSAVVVPHTLPAAGLLRDFVSSILRQQWSTSEDADELRALGEMIGHLIRNCLAGTPAAVPPAPDRRQRVLDFVEVNLGDSTLRTGRIAQALSLSPRAVQSVFVDMATTPSAFIIRRRLARAVARLRDRASYGTLTDLAYELGFSDAAHFSRRFKHAFGASPQVFARGHRGD